MNPKLLLLLLGTLSLAAFGQEELLDPSFRKIPFEKWLNEREQWRVKWTAAAGRPELSFHQRLKVRIEIRVDGRDLESHRSDGRLVFLVQITDREGKRYQDHGSIELDKLDQNIKAANLEYAQQVFMLPGDYKLAVVILDTKTGDHSAILSQFRVPPPQRDPLVDAWRDLPPVEYIAHDEAPESWFLPATKGRLQWASTVKAPARLNVILNVAPSEVQPQSRRSQGGEMEALLPTLKALSQIGSPNISEHIEILDLARRRAVFKQDTAKDLDWDKLKASLGEANTASIDVHSLAERHRSAQFFLSRVRGLLRAESEGPCVLAVLTPAVSFESGEELDQISSEGLSACRIVYIRYRAPVMRMARPFEPMGGMRRGARDPRARTLPPHEIVDQLAGTLKPLSPRVVDVETPEQMARVFNEIEKALAGGK